MVNEGENGAPAADAQRRRQSAVDPAAEAKQDALAAEYGTYEGDRLEGLVRQLRYRGRRARAQATILLWVLSGVIVFAIGVYVLFPYASDWFSGQNQALLAQQRDALSANATLNQRRGPVRNDLVDTLAAHEDSPPLPVSPNALLVGIVAPSDTTWLVWGDRGTLLTYDTAGGAVAMPEGATWDARTSFQGTTQITDTTWFVWGDEGTLLTYDTASGTVAVPGDATWDAGTSFRGTTRITDTTWLVWGSGGTLLTYDTASGTVSVPGGATWDAGTSFREATQITDTTWLVWGDQGTLLTYDTASGTVAVPGGATWEAGTSFRGTTRTSDTTWLVWGNRGTLLTYDTASGRVADLGELGFGDVEVVDAQIELNGAAILVGGYPGGDTSRDPVFFRIALPDLSITPSTVTEWQNAQAESAPGAGPPQSQSGAHDTTLRINPDERVRLMRRTRLYADRAATLDLTGDRDVAGAQATDQRLLDFMDEDLPPHISRDPSVSDLRRRLDSIIGQRIEVAASLARISKSLADIPTGVFRLNQQRETFAAFMRICRGLEPPSAAEGQGQTDASDPSEAIPRADGMAMDPDAVTLACVQAWQTEQQAEAGAWWRTLAAQVPPGILLLFLLATLGGLYRYNLRFAGFHHSRADVLEMMREAGGMDAATLARLSDTLAADKVEFGRANTPSDQAVEIAKAMVSRK
ncbi:MAG: hypothetical protein AAFU80_18100 [Pseudomonadota bacterium]